MTENETKIWCNGQARNLTWSFVLTGSQMRRGIADSSEYTLWMVMAPVAIKMFTVFCFCLVFITTVMLLLSTKFGLPANELLPGTGMAFGFLQRLIKENTIKSCWEFLCGGSAFTGCWLRAGRQLKISPGMQRCHQAPRGSQKYSAVECAWDVQCELLGVNHQGKTGEGAPSFTHTRTQLHHHFCTLQHDSV